MLVASAPHFATHSEEEMWYRWIRKSLILRIMHYYWLAKPSNALYFDNLNVGPTAKMSLFGDLHIITNVNFKRPLEKQILHEAFETFGLFLQTGKWVNNVNYYPEPHNNAERMLRSIFGKKYDLHLNGQRKDFGWLTDFLIWINKY